MRVLIVANDATAAETVRRALRYAPTCRVIGWVDGRKPCGELAATARPDVVVLDESGLPDTTFSRARDVRSALPESKIVLLAAKTDPRLLADAAAAGVDAAVAKTASPASVGMLIREVAAGNVFHFAPSAPAPAGDAHADGILTTRELEILRHVAAGLSNGRIATELWVTEQTVKFHLSNVYRKLGLSNRTEAAHYAHLNGLVDTGPARRALAATAAAA
jgi:DNA-binding NarL/FixJ family response regulator